MEKVTFALDWKKAQRLEIWFGGISSSEVIWGKVFPLSKLECPYLLKQTEQNLIEWLWDSVPSYSYMAYRRCSTSPVILHWHRLSFIRNHCWIRFPGKDLFERIINCLSSVSVDIKSGQLDSDSAISGEKNKHYRVESIVHYAAQGLISKMPQDTFVLELSGRGYQMFYFLFNKTRQKEWRECPPLPISISDFSQSFLFHKIKEIWSWVQFKTIERLIVD